MMAQDIEAAFTRDVNDGMTNTEAIKSVIEVAKKVVPYKRFGTVKTTAYVFWDGSAFLCGMYSNNVFFAARNNYEDLDALYLTGNWD